MDDVALRTLLRHFRHCSKATRCFSRPRGLIRDRFFSEHPDAQEVPSGYGAVIAEATRAIHRDFYNVSADSEIQVSRLSFPLSVLFAQRPSLIIAAFSSNGLSVLLRNETIHFAPDAFVSMCMPQSRRTVWLFAAIVVRAARELQITASDPRGVAVTRVVAWMERFVHGWTTTLPFVLLADEILMVCMKSHDATAQRRP